MLYVVLFFLIFSLYLYVVLGGADYGAGIVELFSSEENQKITKKTIYRVMGPVWEANHIWIIILIVILWIAFPVYYNIMVVSLHIPLTIILLGVTLRGVAFVFRHYDAIIDNSQKLYDNMFKISSLITPIFLGMVFGALISGEIRIVDDISSLTFYEAFVKPWFNVFSILVGLFFAALCAFLSSVLLIGESKEGNENIYIRKSAIATIVVFVVGLLTFGYGYIVENVFVQEFMKNPITIISVVFSAFLLFPLWKTIKKGNTVWSRFFAGLQVFLILSAVLISHYPDIIITQTGSVSLIENIAPDSVINVLGISLIIGGAVILPGLFHLLKSFKMIKILERD
ncbi:cytochrome d ubiquinol oxidase subunit II [Aquimarina sp. EL_43]|uniref:cytochrome d ubiquinol oxidase subunit II n=1 Tax=Aquimarina TaxID=290174 RepID=UPI00046F00BB|nr:MULTISPECIES: cytochrome d ubiquinol oxidase subunit II [Aquimarina]MBG6128985.1 cytochrome d ubiquinol oxidase subunit II [Aquimarina sp. EL_35]MBG6150049.1 cytochrome d ubiquinol oxidase subunit II [Aquimarina sp. EL_32]MBG6167265.1 cytochrome d ubiquinol oxidase subunit II [Aquimarina sp. EL_43]